ncbi:MAG: Branched-chain amino acid aminotransferase [Acetothermia bacterium 64_32]|nr:MAG: Branched-chain amino acid aminotransferase [Acetothermia bacterium 64_32]HAF70368.1 branched chain amino acid aminotransferase [Candidatus Acetothermia bacterium]
MMLKAEKIWLNGELVAWDEAKVHVAAHALHYGSSVFEGIRCYKTEAGPQVFCLDQHLRRLYESCKVYRISVPYPPDVLREAILATVKANGHRACYIRPIVFRGVGSFSLDPREDCPVEVAIITFQWGAYLGEEALERGVDVGVASWARMAPNTYPALAKVGGHYTNSQLVAMEAKDRGFTEGIALDVFGYVSEGSGENVFLVRDGIIYTPPLGASILGGVTRACVIRLARDLGYEVREQLIPREALYIADELFFTGTAAEITPIRSVDGIPIGAGRRGPITKRLQEEFFGIVTGKIPDRHGWLTPVG